MQPENDYLNMVAYHCQKPFGSAMYAHKPAQAKPAPIAKEGVKAVLKQRELITDAMTMEPTYPRERIMLSACFKTADVTRPRQVKDAIRAHV